MFCFAIFYFICYASDALGISNYLKKNAGHMKDTNRRRIFCLFVAIWQRLFAVDLYKQTGSLNLPLGRRPIESKICRYFVRFINYFSLGIPS